MTHDACYGSRAKQTPLRIHDFVNWLSSQFLTYGFLYSLCFSRWHNMSPKSSSNQRRRRGSLEVVDPKHAVDLATAQSYSENVFLFVPNLIGTFHLFRRPLAHYRTVPNTRIHPYHFGWPRTALHELPSKVLHAGICSLLSFGCCGRTSSQSVGADIEIWCRFGHGD